VLSKVFGHLTKGHDALEKGERADSAGKEKTEHENGGPKKKKKKMKEFRGS